MNEKSNFNQAFWYGVGQLGSFLIAFVTAPILSRYFDKVEYGTYSQILYVYGSLQTLFTMGLPSVFAYFIPRLKIGQQKMLINRLTLIFLLLGGAFSLALFFSADIIADLLNNPELSIGIRLFSPFPLFTLPTMGVEGIYSAIRKAKSIAIYHIFSKTMMFLCIVVPVIIWNTGYREAVIGWGISSFVTFLVAMYMKNKPYHRIQMEKIPNMYHDILAYTLPLTGAFIAGFFLNSADQFFVSHYYGTQTFAEFSNGCISIPIVGIVATSVKNVILPLFSKADATNTLDNAVLTYNNSVKRTATIIIPILLFCLFFATDLVVAFFGSKYAISGNYLRIYIIRDFFHIFPYFAILMALGYSRFYMNIHIIGAFVIWGLDFLIVKFCNSLYPIILVSSLFQVGCRISTFIYVFHKTKISFFSKDIQKHICKLMMHGGVCLVVLLFVRNMDWVRYNVFVVLAVFGILYCITILLTSRFVNINYLESVQSLIKSKKK